MTVPQLRVASKGINLGFCALISTKVTEDMEQEPVVPALISAFLLHLTSLCILQI